MNAEHVAAGSVKPRDNDDLVAESETLESFRSPGLYLEPGIGRAFRPCMGASRRVLSSDRITPIGLSRIESGAAARLVIALE